MASKKFTQFVTANNTSETELSVGVKSGDNFKRLNFLTATTNPTVNDDNSDGYTVGSFWFNASTGVMYICKDSTIGAAVWVAQGGSGITSITSTDGSISIDDTDPNAPDLKAQRLFSDDGTTNATASDGRFNVVISGTSSLLIQERLGNIEFGVFNKADADSTSTQAAPIADATNSIDVITQFNTLLAAMRAYGFIAE